MISDSQLYSLALFLGAVSMLLIVAYHFLEINSTPDEDDKISQAKEKSEKS
jgi:hypothetical protein